MGVCGGLTLELGCTASGGYLSFFGERKVPAGGRHADLSTNFLCEETGIYTDEKEKTSS